MLHAQTGISRTEWTERMNQEEQKIRAFTDEQMKQVALDDSLKQSFLSAENRKEISEANLPQILDNYLKDHYRRKYFDLHPDAKELYNPGNVSIEPSAQNKGEGTGTTNILCRDGDFETGALGSYAGYKDMNYFYGNCSYVPATSIFAIPTALTPNDFLLTNNSPDPHIPTLNQTHNGSNHAIRINGYTDCGNFGLNMLQKSFSVGVSGRMRINFAYALVMQNPVQHDVRQSYFIARVLNSSGVEVGSRICIQANAPSGFNTTSQGFPCGSNSETLVWKDWSCDFIEFDGRPNTTYTLEFFVAGCGWHQHYAYAYIDDICVEKCCQDAGPAPAGLGCTPLHNGSRLHWNAVPGATAYRLYITPSDAACCPNGVPPGSLVSYTMNVSSTTVDIANPFQNFCFSWKVAAVMEGGCLTPLSDRMCSCTPAPPPPDGLTCTQTPYCCGSTLSWNPVAGADHYKVLITMNDPACCHRSAAPTGLNVFNVTTTSLTVMNTTASCFSWTVTAIMPHDVPSQSSEVMCSCTPPPPPLDGLNCQPSLDCCGSTLSWNPFPGADHYKVLYTVEDPSCCHNSPYPTGLGVIDNLTTTSATIMNTTAACFSWVAVAVMPDGSTYSSSLMCSCSPQQNGEKSGGAPGSYPAGDNEFINSGAVYARAMPNPAASFIEFAIYNKGNQGNTDDLLLYLYDVNGRLLIKKEITGQEKTRIDVQSYPDGVYIYEIRNKNRSVFKDKIVIRK